MTAEIVWRFLTLVVSSESFEKALPIKTIGCRSLIVSHRLSHDRDLNTAICQPDQLQLYWFRQTTHYLNCDNSCLVVRISRLPAAGENISCQIIDGLRRGSMKVLQKAHGLLCCLPRQDEDAYMQASFCFFCNRCNAVRNRYLLNGSIGACTGNETKHFIPFSQQEASRGEAEPRPTGRNTPHEALIRAGLICCSHSRSSSRVPTTPSKTSWKPPVKRGKIAGNAWAHSSHWC